MTRFEFGRSVLLGGILAFAVLTVAGAFFPGLGFWLLIVMAANALAAAFFLSKVLK